MLNPSTFWQAYKKALLNRGTMTAYRSDSLWTQVTIEAARDAAKHFGMSVWPEYLHLDLAAGKSIVPGRQWELQLAYEHENADDWEYELCKLTDIVADLRVLVAYCKFDISDEVLNGRVQKHIDRMNRVPNSQWLIIFGPRYGTEEQAFRPFEIIEGSLVRIEDPEPLTLGRLA